MPLNWLDSLLNRKTGPCGRRSGAEDHSPEPALQIEQMEDRLTPGLSVTTPGVAQLVQTLTNGNVQVTNVTSEGVNAALGAFTGGTGIIGFESGVVLSTGLAKSVVGPFAPGNPANTANGTPGDPKITAIAGFPTFDAAGVSFDFVPTGNTLTFSYVFASDEYNAFVGTAFNDAFGFFLNNKNVALVPGTNMPISINNINDGNPGTGAPAVNPQFFIDNSTGANAGHLNTTMNGLTTVLSVVLAVTPGKSYHVKLAIADATDNTIDSNVFIQQGSFATAQVNSYAPIRYQATSQAPFKQNVLSGNVTIFNQGSNTINGPLFAVFTSLPKGVTVVNATGTTPSGSQFIALPPNVSLPPNRPFYLNVTLSNELLQPLPTFYQGLSVAVTNVLT